MTDSLAELRDRIEIAELYVRYALALDEVDLGTLASCFAEDVEFVPGDPQVPARPGIKANQDRLVERHKEKAFRERHLTSRPVIRRLAADRAEAACEYAIFEHVKGASPRVVSMGRGEDKLAKRNGRWVFARRQAFRDP